MRYQEVMLIRCPPGGAGAEELLAALARATPARRLLFFHGPGLAWATSKGGKLDRVADEENPTLMLCSAGWRRRQTELPPPGWQLGSLVQFWDAADHADRVFSFGALT